MRSVLLVLVVFVCLVQGEDGTEVEARGKGKYALLINLATLLAAKVGLYKIFLGIAVVIASVKLFVFMAWALAIFKYVPDPYIYYKTVDYKPQHGYNPFGHGHFDPYTQKHDIGKDALDFFVNYAIHFFYVAATKLFVLKLIYGALLYVIATKAWHFALWFIHYLKEKKHEHYEYLEYDHEPYHHHDSFDHDSYGPQPYAYEKYGHKKRIYEKGPSKPSYGSSYGSGSSQGFGSNHGSGSYGSGSPPDAYGRPMYDADGSYSVKSR